MLQPKTFCGQKNSTRFFFVNFFLIFEKKIIFEFLFVEKSMKIEIFKILKNQNFGFFEKFFENIFSKNRVEFFWPQKVFGCNFWKNKYFFTNPKAYEADCPWLPFPLLDIKNGPLRKKLSPKNLGGLLIMRHSLIGENPRNASYQSKIATGTELACRKVPPSKIRVELQKARCYYCRHARLGCCSCRGFERNACPRI